VIALAALATPPRIERVAFPATNIHRPSEQVHDDIAAAEDGDSYDNVEQNLFQEPKTTSEGLSRFL